LGEEKCTPPKKKPGYAYEKRAPALRWYGAPEWGGIVTHLISCALEIFLLTYLLSPAVGARRSRSCEKTTAPPHGTVHWSFFFGSCCSVRMSSVGGVYVGATFSVEQMIWFTSAAVHKYTTVRGKQLNRGRFDGCVHYGCITRLATAAAAAR